ncbi:unnamed protein product [Heligmosomoides polygyrus]|uniref:Reverse transcriptase domain-containing protein n=1 Tax=Heligmosomoides polygyrus TaxID=6339 RepID=A0A183GII5_HELPZ|nr:unnamed protein product [Heligmosomoides polygyrus]
MLPVRRHGSTTVKDHHALRALLRVLRELYSGFTTKISPFYNDVLINVKRGVRQEDTIFPKLFSAYLENGTRELELEDKEVKANDRQPTIFADDIVLTTQPGDRLRLCMWESWTAAETYEDDVH